MATITAYARESSITDSDITLSNGANLIDTDESTAASFNIKRNASGDFMVGNFDFTAIPAGSTINSVAMKTYVATGANSDVRIIACRKYANNEYVSQGTNYDEVLVSASKSGEYTFTSRIGTWTRDELAITPQSGVKNGPWFYVRIKNTSSLYARTTSFRYFKIVVDYTLPTYTLTVNATEGGTVTGGGTYESGTTVTLKATPNTGYKFKQWSDGNTNATRTVTVTGNATYTAQFELQTYTVRWFNDDGTLLETDSNVPYGTIPTYNGATPIKNEDNPEFDYTFKGWHIDITSSDVIELEPVIKSIDYYARYTETVSKYTVLWKNFDGTVLETDTTEYGTLPTYDGATPTKPATQQYTYNFLGWDTTIEEVTRDVVYTAVFTEQLQYYTITTEITPENSGTVEGVISGNNFGYGSERTLTAVPAIGYKFRQWSDGNTNATRTVTVTANATYTAQFEKVTVAISANVSPSEGGTVTGTGIYEYEETYTLTAVPNEGYKFVRWSTWDTSPSITRTARTVDEEFIAYFEKEETSNIFIGNQRVSAYLGTQKVSVYIGTQKLS